MGRRIEDILQRAAFHDLAVVHDHDFLRQVGDHAQVMGDDNNRHIEFLLQILQQLQDLCLDRNVQGGRWLVRDQQRRPADQGHSDHGPLPQAPGKLERVRLQGFCRIGKSDELQHLLREFLSFFAIDLPVQMQGLQNLVPDGVHGRERGHRLLKNDGDPTTAN